MSSAFENFDLYEELEVKKTATQEEIKKSYRKLAMVNIIILNIEIIFLEMASGQKQARSQVC